MHSLELCHYHVMNVVFTCLALFGSLMEPLQVLLDASWCYLWCFWSRRLKTLWPWWNGAWEMMQEEVKAWIHSSCSEERPWERQSEVIAMDLSTWEFTCEIWEMCPCVQVNGIWLRPGGGMGFLCLAAGNGVSVCFSRIENGYRPTGPHNHCMV